MYVVKYDRNFKFNSLQIVTVNKLTKGYEMRLPNDHPAFLLLQDFCHFYTERNMNKILNLFSTHQKIFILGTGIDETRVDINGLKEQLERDWSQSESGTLTLDPNVVTSGIDASSHKAWAYGVCTAEVKSMVKNIILPR